MSVTLRTLDAALLPAFRPYLLPEAARAVAEGDGSVAALGAVTENLQTCGAVAGELYRGELTVFSLYVDPAARRQGVATLLLDGLLAAVPGAKAVRAEWILPEEDFQGMSAFLSARGFTCGGPEDPVLRLPFDGLRQSPLLRRAFSPDFRPAGNLVPVSAFTPAERAELDGDPSIDPALRLSAFDPERLAHPMCLGCRYGGRIAAYLLAEPTVDGVAVLAAVSRKGAHPAAILQLAAAALHASLPYLPETGGACWLQAVNDASRALARSLCGAELQPWYTGSAAR